MFGHIVVLTLNVRVTTHCCHFEVGYAVPYGTDKQKGGLFLWLLLMARAYFTDMFKVQFILGVVLLELA